MTTRKLVATLAFASLVAAASLPARAETEMPSAHARMPSAGAVMPSKTANTPFGRVTTPHLHIGTPSLWISTPHLTLPFGPKQHHYRARRQARA
jgi:hypothetical protein